MEIKIDQEQIKGLVAEGIFAQFTGELRDQIIQQAVRQLFEPRERRHHESFSFKPPSPFMEAFNDAARLACGEILRGMAADEDSDLRKLINTQLAEVLAGLQDQEDPGGAEYLSDLQRQIAHAIGETIVQGWSRRKFDGDGY